MIMKLSRSVNKVLVEANDDLAILVTRTRQLSYLTQVLRQQLESDLAIHCYIGKVDKDALVILVDSAAWASKLRFYSQTLLPQLQMAHHSFASLQQIKIKILSQSVTLPEPVYQRPTMNKENAKGLNTLADSIKDVELQAALVRLAKRAK